MSAIKITFRDWIILFIAIILAAINAKLGLQQIVTINRRHWFYLSSQ